MSNQKKDKREHTNPFVWFLFAIVVPLIVAVTLAFIIFSISGVDTIGWIKSVAKEMPVISTIGSSDKEKTPIKEELTDQETKDKESENNNIQNLQEENKKLQDQISELEKENVNLEKSLESTVNKESEVDSEPTEIQQFVGSFKDMDPKQAAQIFENMNERTALSILKEMPNKVRGGILEAMDPKQAASLTQKILHEN